MTDAHVLSEVADAQGNITRVQTTFATQEASVFRDGFETGDVSRWSFSTLE